MEQLVDLNSYPVNLVLNRLLKDKTTNRNIIFATEDYGNDIHFDTHLSVKVLLDQSKCNIKPRVQKSLEEQSNRTRKKAEVFTPSWVCNKMNNHCDSEWFGRDNIFNVEDDNTWTATTEKIEMPDGKTWKDYVLSMRLEITCGEAPYIVSRYDASTGDIIPLEQRIGILDRKIRIVNENVNNEQEWLKWIYKAYQSVYGYEYQGDNLLIARINLLNTFCEYYKSRWNKGATISQLQKVTDIINWNIWQMDGINGIVPMQNILQEEPTEVVNQVTVFDIFEELGLEKTKKKNTKTLNLDNCIECILYDWQSEEKISYNSIKKG